MARTMLEKLKKGLFMTHTEFLEKVGETFRRSGPVAPEQLDGLEDALIAADTGVELSLRLTDELREEVRSGRISSAEELRPAVRTRLLDLLRSTAEDAGEVTTGSPRITMLVGVNGTGKTTTAAKLAKRRREAGRSVLLAAADTFRAAAVEQLRVWADRLDVPLVHQAEGADPAAVVFDAIAAARARGIDEVIVDTAGRLHTRTNLMKELEKVRKVAEREVEGAPHEVLLVLDATTGSNGIEQAKRFGATAGVNGVVLTKLDGTAKGGVILAIAEGLGLPVRWVGVGEAADDLLPFDAEEFVDALLELS
ncbi:MAG: signal recognition particle-docking protein FtsY [Acidobacteria bacterium]|jgi:fused signal recognition particle receptor|nr:signal recognition particle-docking protein FtsY [Acidobacteriota bacterium]